MEALDGDSPMQSNISSEREKENRKQAENKLYGDVTMFHDFYTAQNILLLTGSVSYECDTTNNFFNGSYAIAQLEVATSSEFTNVMRH